MRAIGLWSAVTLGVVAFAPACGGRSEEQSSAGEEVVQAVACVHPICSTGKKLSSSCDPCVTKICKADSYCCRSSWDSQCVGEVASICKESCSSPPDAGSSDSGGADSGPADSGADANDASPADSGPKPDAGPGSIGPNGGTLAQLSFGVVGDTRPANIDDTAGYPTAIISQIYADLIARSDEPPFVVSTGDYNFSSTTSGEAANQFALYMQARAKYPGVWFPAMGNHECTGYTNSNCGQGTADGITENYTGFLSQLLGPIQKTEPYYVIHVSAADGSWTSKFVFVAANAWTSAQASWLSSALAEATTYTFVVRHEAADVTTAPGVSPSESIMKGYPYTLAIVGHSHTYSHSGRELLVGNGGAPLTGSGNYGYALAKRRSSDGAIVVDMYDYETNAADSSFHFAVNADGSAASP